MRRGLWLIVPGLLWTGAACGRSGGSETPPPIDRPVSVEVTNHYALPMEIRAVGSGINHRLGTVHPGMDGHFTIPPGLIGNGSVEFLASPTPPTGGVYRSGPLLIAPGRTVDVVISAQLFNSTATLRP